MSSDERQAYKTNLSFIQWLLLIFFWETRHCHSKGIALWLQYTALYRLRKWFTLSINGNKIYWNLFKALCVEQNDVISGIYWVIDILSLSLSSLPFYFVSLPLLHSPPSLAPSPTESGWPGMSSPTEGTASNQRGAVCSVRISTRAFRASSRPTVYLSGAVIKHSNLQAPLKTAHLKKNDGWLLPVTVLITVKSSWVQQPNQLAGSDALLCLFHLATSAIILTPKRSVNNLIINSEKKGIRKVFKHKWDLPSWKLPAFVS